MRCFVVLSFGGDFLKTSNFRKNPMDILSLVFTTIGIILVFTAIVVSVKNINFTNNSKQITAIVSNIAVQNDNNNKKYKDTLLNYHFDGKDYENVSLGTYLNKANIGDSVEVYVREDNPFEIQANKGEFLLPIFLFVLGALLLVSAVMAKKSIEKRKKEIEYLLTNGNKIIAKVLDVDINTALGFGSKRPRIIIAIASNQKEKYYSDNLWIAPDYDIIGVDIDVYINKQDTKKYYVDIRKFEEN